MDSQKGVKTGENRRAERIIIKGALTLAVIAPCASAQSSFDQLGYVAGLFGLLALFYTYKLISRKNGLDLEIAQKAALLNKLRTEIKVTQDELRSVRRDTVMAQEAKVSEEMTKTQDVADSRKKQLGMSRDYWDRIEALSTITPENPELKKLLDQKAEVEAMITMTKAKYAELDEKSFNNIIEGYQKMMIELDIKIKKMKSDVDGG